MLAWTLKQWLSEPSRTAIAAAVYAAVIAICMLFDGLFLGIVEDLKQFPASLPADFVALETGTTNFSMSPSQLPQLTRPQAESLPEVIEAEPIFQLPVIFKHAGRQTPTLLIAYNKRGAPRTLLSGQLPGIGREIVIDQSLAKRHDVKIGDRVEVLGDRLAVVGISVGTSSPFTPYMFISYDRLIDLLIELELPFGDGNSSMLSALLIETDASADLEDTRQKLESVMPDADLYTPQELGQADADLGARMLGPILFLLSGVGWLIAIMTISLMRFTEIQTHLREFGVMKAMGAKPFWLAGALVMGGLWLVLIAFPLAILFASGLAWLTWLWNPLYSPDVLALEVLLRGGLVAVVAALLGGIVWYQKLSRLDPMIVFQR